MGDELVYEDGLVYFDGLNIWERCKWYSVNSLSVFCDNLWGWCV